MKPSTIYHPSKAVFYADWKTDFEEMCDELLVSVHEALVGANRIDFGHSGYDGMVDLCDNDHEMLIFKDEVILIASVAFGIPYSDGWVVPPPRAA